MSIKLDTQYQKLKEIALRANLVWHEYEGGESYKGHVSPVGIYIRTHSKHFVNFGFILAERVPPQQLPEGSWDERTPGGFITAALDNNFEFEEWDSASNTLMVDCDCSPDGTFWAKCEDLAHKPDVAASYAFLFYEAQGNGYTGMLMQKR
jgi:hypothetical protein